MYRHNIIRAIPHWHCTSKVAIGVELVLAYMILLHSLWASEKHPESIHPAEGRKLRLECGSYTLFHVHISYTSLHNNLVMWYFMQVNLGHVSVLLFPPQPKIPLWLENLNPILTVGYSLTYKVMYILPEYLPSRITVLSAPRQYALKIIVTCLV